MKTEKFTILGACKVSIGYILDCLYSQYKNNSRIFVDIIHNLPLEENQYAALDFIHPSISVRELWYDDWKPNGNEQLILSGMAPSTKRKIFHFFYKHFGIDRYNYISVIHKTAYVSHGVKIEKPVLLTGGSIIEHYVELEKFVSVFTKTVVAHHSRIKAFSSILMGSNIAGFCSIGGNVIIGMGSNIFNRVSIGDNTFIGGGSVVTKSIPADAIAYGIPAKIVRHS
ncbi:hypothetical protein [Hydrogenimonas urashimensis]|uniref:hypothetical protein n=1 Tax=Hydrogenimonas urashimensis TaxID=2740515 RepID=UPI00191525BA|nr:hypothetical protein [Hydrogenimonas urashimensis]